MQEKERIRTTGYEVLAFAYLLHGHAMFKTSRTEPLQQTLHYKSIVRSINQVVTADYFLVYLDF
jgi:hypothetical protein